MDGFFDAVRQHWLWVIGLLTILANLALLVLAQRFALKTDVGGLATRVDQLERETVLIGERMRHMPTSDDMKALQAAVAVQNASIEKLNAKSEGHTGALSSISDQLGMLTNHLLGRGDK
ncbi:DUF2730 family protein [Inquilinus sp. YAF38]|uniref:DUF2730 family protein n=1 Tax=Inquilinus sp. YAF38 TaxID=3233084 RepID=UPI003F92270C